MKVVAEKINGVPAVRRGRPPSAEIVLMKTELSEFYDLYYETSDFQEPLPITNMLSVLEYAANDVVTAYETNIKEHFADYLHRFVGVLLDRYVSMNAYR